MLHHMRNNPIKNTENCIFRFIVCALNCLQLCLILEQHARLPHAIISMSAYIKLMLIVGSPRELSSFQINELSHVNIPVMLLPDDFKAYSKLKVDNHLFNKLVFFVRGVSVNILNQSVT